MVTGMEQFRRHFAGYDESFVIIGGAACDEWFARDGERFRVTKDIDVVLLGGEHSRFARRFWDFVRAGGYEVGQRQDQRRTYYRFIRPRVDGFPKMIELFSPVPVTIEPAKGQQIVPVIVDEEVSNLSAILLDSDYYKFLVAQRGVVDGLPLVKPAGLIPLKARAWLDLSRRRAGGELRIGEDTINKHRADIFRLATRLPVGVTLALPPIIAADFDAFLLAFPAHSFAWVDIQKSLNAFGIRLPAGELLEVLRSFYERGS